MMMLSIVLPPQIFPFHIVNFYSCVKHNESSKIEIISMSKTQKRYTCSFQKHTIHN